MIHCTLCDKPSRKVGASGVFLTRGGCRSPWQLCPECALRFQRAGETERGGLFVLIEATITDSGMCG